MLHKKDSTAAESCECEVKRKPKNQDKARRWRIKSREQRESKNESKKDERENRDDNNRRNVSQTHNENKESFEDLGGKRKDIETLTLDLGEEATFLLLSSSVDLRRSVRLQIYIPKSMDFTGDVGWTRVVSQEKGVSKGGIKGGIIMREKS